MKKTGLLLTVFLSVCSVFFGYHLMNAMAEEPAATFNRYYTSVAIEEGDNLWKIASIYNHNSGMSTIEYIEELKSMNQLKGDTIHAGGYLTVVYFCEEPNE